LGLLEQPASKTDNKLDSKEPKWKAKQEPESYYQEFINVKSIKMLTKLSQKAQYLLPAQELEATEQPGY
jgi:hypothetical protein